MDIKAKIIIAVSKYDCLYNTRSPSYKSIQYKESIWNKIAHDVQLPVNEVKNTFRSTRDTYKKYRRTVDAPTNDTTFRKPYKYAELFKFLDDIPTPECTSYHISESSLDIPADFGSDTECAYPKKTKLENYEDPPEDPFNMPTSSSVITPTNKTTKTKRKTRPNMNCTKKLFQCLASKVTATKLTMDQRNDIESSVCKLVYTKIAEYTADYNLNY